jgi:chorismate mutase
MITTHQEMILKMKMDVYLELEKWAFQGAAAARPLVCAGPCSAESERQMMDTARLLKACGVMIFRAGIWKPRTRPGAFEGVGSKGLAWLNKVKDEFGMSTATEVANAGHVAEALKGGVDMLWIGARTTANPFAVQDIANALGGVDIPVLIKNPINPDLELWIGAFERINRSGIKKLAAIHRGFSTYRRSSYRNSPRWQIPIELKRRIPNLPILTDPSHICGRRNMIHEVSQKAMDLDFDGLFIEAHVSPETAMSDAEQQIDCQELSALLDGLVLRKANIDNARVMQVIEDLRDEIDGLDDRLLELLENRMKTVVQIGLLKKEHRVTIFQSTRWDEMLRRRIHQAGERGLSREFLERLFRAIHQESINHQARVMN